MITYTVHEPAAPQSDRLDRADELQFVKDGFSWITALCPPVGFMMQRLWLPAIAYLVAIVALVALFMMLGIGDGWLGLIVMALNLYLGFESSSLRRWSLDRAGWTTLGSVNGSNLADCERRFLEGWLPSQPIIKSPASSGGAEPRRTSGPWPFGARA